MKKRIAALLLFAMFAVCLADSDTPMTIKTLDGQVYENAVVEGVHPGGIDIGFVNSHGDYVLKGLSFKVLPDNIRKQYGYNPTENDRFDAQVKAHAQDDPNQVVEAEKARLERITKEIKEKFAGQNIKIKPEDLRFAIYAKRLSVILSPVSSSLTGCVAKIVEVESGTPVSAQLIQIDSAALPTGVNWSGFIYPTGLKTRYQGNPIPVYADSLDRAVLLANHYLDIYCEYAAEGGAQQQTDNANAAPPDQDISQQASQQNNPPQDQSYAQQQPQQQQPSQDQQQQQPQQQSSQDQQYQPQQQYSYNNDGGNYYPDYGGYYPGYAYAYGPGVIGGGCYYIGNYQPVNWWNHRHYPNNNWPHRYYNPDNRNRPYPNNNRPSQGGGNSPSNDNRTGGGRSQWGYNPSGNYGGRSYNQYQGMMQTPTHNIQSYGNFRRAEPRREGGEMRRYEGGERRGEGGSRGGYRR